MLLCLIAAGVYAIPLYLVLGPPWAQGARRPRKESGRKQESRAKKGTEASAGAASKSNEEATSVLPASWVAVETGALPIVITAPHAGAPRTGRIPGVPPRVGAGVVQFTTSWDVATGTLAEEVAAEIERIVQRRPHLVIARFNRSYIDANRLPEGAFEHEAARAPYDAYHAAVRAALGEVRGTFGRGLLIDLHGQSTAPEAVFRGTRNGRSICALLESDGWEAVVGECSIFGGLRAAGYQVLPEGSGREREYNGGYTVATYGSHRPGGIDAMQIEVGYALRTDPERRVALAGALARSIVTFYRAVLSRAEAEASRR